MIWDYRDVFARGVLVTVQLTIIAVAIGIVLGLILGLMRGAGNWLLFAPATIYIETFRSTPTLVQLVWIYYALPMLTGVQLSAFNSVALGLGLHTGAYLAEIFRAGINSIDRGQMMAAKAIGMSYVQAMRRIILPQATRRMIPPFINEFATLIKLTSLGSILAVPEVMHEANDIISETFRPLETYTALALVFALIAGPMIFFARMLERTLAARS
jgi:polar amino acid transport system permease protein